MPRRLELDSLRADLAAVEGLLSIRDEKNDPLGWIQYGHKKREIEEAIAVLELSNEPRAEIALFFGGRPVLGSRGIASDFATRIIGSFQALVADKYAATSLAQLPARGPAPQRDQSSLLISDIVRGSFGFVLSEADNDSSLLDTKLKETVAELADAIYRFSAADTESLDHAYDELDPRILKEITTFFSYMDNAGATLRIVEGDRDFSLDSDAVLRGRRRAESLDIEERSDAEFRGYLYFLPLGCRFNLLPEGGGEAIAGVVDRDLREALYDSEGRPRSEYLGQIISARLSERILSEYGKKRHITFTLKEIIR